MSGSDKTKLDGLGLTAKGTADAWSTTNIASLSGLANTVDSIAINADGMEVCSASQTTTTQDGCWLAHSGAWTRAPELAAGALATNGYYIVPTGTSNKGVWVFKGGIAGTNDLTSSNLVSGGGGGGLTSPLSAALDFGTNKGTNAGTPTAATDLATKGYVDGVVTLAANAATTAALPSYTTSGGPGVGFTLTASSNGALGAQDGITLSTGDELFLEHGASATDNGLYVLTQGTGGTPWVLLRDTRLDQAAEIPGSTVSVRTGIQRGTGVYKYRAVGAVTMGTTNLFWLRTDAGATTNEVIRFGDEINDVVYASNAYAPTSFDRFSSGTATGTIDSTNTGTTIGVHSCSITSAATGICGLSSAWTAANTAPGGGLSWTLDTSSHTFEFETRVQVPVLSNGTDTFAINAGLMKQKAVNQKIPADGCAFIYDTTSGVSATNWMGVCANAGTGTPVDLGVTVNAGTYVRAWEAYDAGSTTGVRFGIDSSTTLTSVTANLPNGTVLGAAVQAAKIAGAGAVNAMKTDWVRGAIYFPKGRVP